MKTTLTAALLALLMLSPAVAHADPDPGKDNPNCRLPILLGMNLTDSEKLALTKSRPPTSYQCDEPQYLRLLARDKITGDPVALIKQGYAVCPFFGPPGSVDKSDDRDTGTDMKEATAAVTAAGVAPSDAENLVTDATIELC